MVGFVRSVKDTDCRRGIGPLFGPSGCLGGVSGAAKGILAQCLLVNGLRIDQPGGSASGGSITVPHSLSWVRLPSQRFVPLIYPTMLKSQKKYSYTKFGVRSQFF